MRHFIINNFLHAAKKKEEEREEREIKGEREGREKRRVNALSPLFLAEGGEGEKKEK